MPTPTETLRSNLTPDKFPACVPPQKRSARKSKRLERAIEIATQECQRPWHERVAWNHKGSENDATGNNEHASAERKRARADENTVDGVVRGPQPQCKRKKSTKIDGTPTVADTDGGTCVGTSVPIGARVYVHYEDVDGAGTARWLAGRCVDAREGPCGAEFKVEYERAGGGLEHEWESLSDGSVYICEQGAVPFGKDVELDLADEGDTTTAIFAAPAPHDLPAFFNHVLLRCA